MGIFIASTIIILWGAHLYYALTSVVPDPSNPYLYIHVIIQGFLFTGLFITGHDAMHNTVAKNRNVNKFFGYLTCFLFAGLSFKRLLKNHRLHHRYPATERDPDYSPGSQNIFRWMSLFMYHYVTVTQLIIMAVTFNLLKLFSNDISLIVFWVIPAFLGTFQLFFFGTYGPHKLPHTESMLPHKARSQKKNDFIAFISCYYFGYHYEHHESPGTPWWRLPVFKKNYLQK
ncbi:MAG: fatty acid desaturase [Ignavibacteriaceae bacterium]